MTKLQNVADAYKELENRRKNRKKKGPQPGGNKFSNVMLFTARRMCIAQTVLHLNVAMGTLLMGRQIQEGCEKISIFDQYLALSQK